MSSTTPRTTTDATRLVLICEGCRYAWEPLAAEWTTDHLRAFAAGCPECGDWLYLGELADHPRPRRAER